MSRHFLYLAISVAGLSSFPAALRAQAGSSPPGGQTVYVRNFSQTPQTFPYVWRPYFEQQIDPPVLENSPRLAGLIHSGKLELSLADAVALTLENNLDIVVQRYVVPFSQTDILRTKSGQAARGFTGALFPGELNSGAIGAGVTSAGSTGGTGNAGGITGGGGAVSVGAAGAFDPSVSFGFSLRPRHQPAQLPGGLRHSHHHQLRHRLSFSLRPDCSPTAPATRSR